MKQCFDSEDQDNTLTMCLLHLHLLLHKVRYAAPFDLWDNSIIPLILTAAVEEKLAEVRSLLDELRLQLMAAQSDKAMLESTFAAEKAELLRTVHEKVEEKTVRNLLFVIQ